MAKSGYSWVNPANSATRTGYGGNRGYGRASSYGGNSYAKGGYGPDIPVITQSVSIIMLMLKLAAEPLKIKKVYQL